MTRKEYFEEFRRNGVTITQELVRRGEYTGEPMVWAEGWIASKQRPKLALTLSVLAIVISILAWLLPR
jgi:hypothetical protein